MNVIILRDTIRSEIGEMLPGFATVIARVDVPEDGHADVHARALRHRGHEFL